MCWLCRQILSREQVVNQLKSALTNIKTDPYYFYNFNTTSVVNILYSCVGLDGFEAKEVGLELLELLIDWVKYKPSGYIPKTGIEPMYHYKVLLNLHTWAKNFTNPDNLIENQIVELIGKKIYEFKKSQENKELLVSFGTSLGVASFGIGLFFWYRKYLQTN